MLRSSFLLRFVSKRFCSSNYINPKASYYKLLGISEKATFEEIQTAFQVKCESINVKIGPEGFENSVRI